MSGAATHRAGMRTHGAGVAMVQALFWRADSPVDASGAVCFETLAAGLGRAPYDARHPSYTHAQHAVIVSQAVVILAELKLKDRRVLAMHACLADARSSWANEAENGKDGAVLRTADVEAFAAAWARTCHWRVQPGDRSDVPFGAVALDELLVRLSGLGKDDRRRLALYGLLTETVAAGLGTGAAEAALRAAGLSPRAPHAWAECLRFVRRMVAATAVRDCRSGIALDREAFPALKHKIDPVDGELAARRWLERYRELTAGRPGADERGNGITGGHT